MLKSAGMVLTAGGIVAANDVIFAPMAGGKNSNLPDLNWRIVPATAILALVLGGLEKISEPLGTGLAGLTLLAVLIVPVGNAPTPLENVASVFGTNAKKAVQSTGNYTAAANVGSVAAERIP